MSGKGLAVRVAERTGLSQAQVRRVLASLSDVATEMLLEGEAVSLPGLFVARRRWAAPRQVRSVRTARRMELDGRWTPSFRASASLRRRLVEATPQPWRDPARRAAARLADALVGDIALYHADALPLPLPADASWVEVDVACAAALGPVWERARQTWLAEVPAALDGREDLLVRAIRAHWWTGP